MPIAYFVVFINCSTTKYALAIYPKATIILAIKAMSATGAQIRSILLGVMVFKMVLNTKNATTPQMAFCAKGVISVKNKFAFAATIDAIKLKIRIFIKATTLILGGYLPEYLPPIEAAPHGKPAIKQN